MGRKSAAQLDLELPDEEPVQPPPEPPVSRRVKAKLAEPRPDRMSKVRTVLIWTAASVAVIAFIVVGYQIDEFLASGSQFILAGSPDTARPNPSLRIDGVVYTPREEVVRAFAQDFGRSIYLTPLAERRRRLLAIDWVKEASVSRRWPNRLEVRITERTPIAFAMLPSLVGGRWAIAETALVDGEGVIMRLPAKAQFSLPALFGIARRDPPAIRRVRAEQAVEFLSEIGSYAGQVSEIDVSDSENLTITEVAQGRPLRLRLGDRNYLSKLSNFLTHYSDISKRLPGARTFDLRLDNHITAQDGGPNAK